MADYGKVFRRVWSNPKFRRASEDCRTLTLYLLTNEHGTSEGLYRLPAAYAAADLQWTTERYETAFAEVEQIGFVERDPDLDLVLIVNALEFNKPSTDNHVKGAANALAEIRDSPLRRRFLQQCAIHCPALLDALTSQNGWSADVIGTESEGHPNAMAMPSECHGDAMATESEGSPNTPPPPPLSTHHYSLSQEGLSTGAHGSGNDADDLELLEQLATSKARDTRTALLAAIRAATASGRTHHEITTAARRAAGTGPKRDHAAAQAISELARERPNVAARSGGVERVLDALPERASPPPTGIRAALTRTNGDAA